MNLKHLTGRKRAQIFLTEDADIREWRISKYSLAGQLRGCVCYLQYILCIEKKLDF